MNQQMIDDVYALLCEKAPIGRETDPHWYHEQICRARTLLARYTSNDSRLIVNQATGEVWEKGTGGV